MISRPANCSEESCRAPRVSRSLDGTCALRGERDWSGQAPASPSLMLFDFSRRPISWFWGKCDRAQAGFTHRVLQDISCPVPVGTSLGRDSFALPIYPEVAVTSVPVSLGVIPVCKHDWKRETQGETKWT